MRQAVRLFVILVVGACLKHVVSCDGVFISDALAQVIDDFSDGDFTNDPTWTGDTASWVVEDTGESPVLATYGAAASDTIYLAVAHAMSFGRWTFTFSHRRVNLSTFNGARVFVCATEDSVRARPAGYYVQFGTNNTDAVSLWHVDGDWSKRQELGRSLEPLVAGESSHLDVTVVRDPTTGWRVLVNGTDVVRAAGESSELCSHLALWVKHTRAGSASFVFDAFSAEGAPPAPPARRPGPLDIVINEIQVDPPPFGSEFVELYNRSTSSFLLKTLTIRDAAAAPVPITDGTYELLPAEYAVLVQDGESFRDQFRTVPFITTSPWPTLNNRGDVVVVETDGLVIDSLTFSGDDIRPDHSLERIDPDAPSNRSNFAPSNGAFGASPGSRNSRFQRDRTSPQLLFVKEIDERRLDLQFDEPIRADSTPIIVVADGAEAAGVARLAPDLFQASFVAPVRALSVEVSGAVDLRGNRSEHLTAPISFRPMPSDVIVNEILYEPLSEDRDGIQDQVEYVEIMNRSDRRVHVDGLYRTREPDEHGDADTVRVRNQLLALDPKELLVLASDSFAASAPVVVLASLTLLNRGDRIRLHNSQSAVLDDVYFAPSWHHPDLLARRGVSLERIDPHSAGDDPANWSSSVDPSGATPGLPNSVRLQPQGRTSRSGLTISPNPFSPDRDGVDDVVQITYVPSADLSRVRLRIFDLSGMMVREIVSSHLIAESASFLWDGRDAAGRRVRTGVYVAIVEAYDARNDVAEAFKHPVVLARRY